jgi:hypothetical protein
MLLAPRLDVDVSPSELVGHVLKENLRAVLANARAIKITFSDSALTTSLGAGDNNYAATYGSFGGGILRKSAKYRSRMSRRMLARVVSPLLAHMM